MPLVTSEEMLSKAQEGGYAVGAFNAENMEMVKAIIQAAEELKAPVMIQTTPSTIKYGTVETYAAIVAVTCLPMVSVAKTLPSSPENECCATFPKERIIAITAAALNWRCRQCTQGILPS